MKLSAIAIVLALFMSADTRLASAEEKPAPVFTALSSTTISGYVHTGTHWQTHVCRPVRPIRTQRVVVDPADGPPRVVGHVVRCRHALILVPNATAARAFPTPNRSSRFGPASSRAATVHIDYQTHLVLVEAIRVRDLQPNRPPLPPLPPEPRIPTNWPPIIVEVNHYEHSVPPLPPIIPPHQRPGVPPVIVPPSSASRSSVSAVRSTLGEQAYRDYERRWLRARESVR
jgi:hypothetical protein